MARATSCCSSSSNASLSARAFDGIDFDAGEVDSPRSRKRAWAAPSSGEGQRNRKHQLGQDHQSAPVPVGYGPAQAQHSARSIHCDLHGYGDAASRWAGDPPIPRDGDARGRALPGPTSLSPASAACDTMIEDRGANPSNDNASLSRDKSARPNPRRRHLRSTTSDRRIIIAPPPPADRSPAGHSGSPPFC
jgi:hypothetical protein